MRQPKIPELKFAVSTGQLRAGTRKLRGRWTVESPQELQGFDLPTNSWWRRIKYKYDRIKNPEIASKTIFDRFMALEIQKEIDTEILKQLLQASVSTN